jgi:hypothetical protein
MRYRWTLIAVLIAVTLVSTRRLHAEDLERELQEHFAKIRSHATTELTTPPQIEAPSVPSNEGASDTEMFNLPVASHVRSTDGIPFPSPSDVELDPNPPAYQEALKSGAQPSISIPVMPYRRPGACEKNVTIREPIESLNDSPEKTIYDVLYVSQDLVPIDPEEVYGARAKVWGYGVTGDESVYTRMETHNIPCVPYRIRITNKAKYEDSGVNALRNYDANPAGNGTLSPWVHQQMSGRTVGAKRPQRRR